MLAAAEPASGPRGTSAASGVSAGEVTVVVCTRDRPRLLHDCLLSLAKLDPAPAEVVVVDRGSATDPTQQVSEALAGSYLSAPDAGLAAARNRGWEAAGSDVVAFVGDDTRTHPTYAAAVAEAFAAPEVGVMTGLVAPGELTTLPQRLFEQLGGLNRGYDWQLHGPAQWPATLRLDRRGTGTNLAVRRTTLESLGGFDEGLDVVPRSSRDATRTGADLHLVAQALRKGWSAAHQPHAVVRRTSPRDWPGLFTEMRDNGAAYAAVLDRLEHELPELAAVLPAVRRRWHLRDHVRAPLAALRRRKPWAAALMLVEAAGSRPTRSGAGS